MVPGASEQSLESVRINRSWQGWAVFDLKLERQEAEEWLHMVWEVQEPRALIYERLAESTWEPRQYLQIPSPRVDGMFLWAAVSTFLGNKWRLFKSNYSVTEKETWKVHEENLPGSLSPRAWAREAPGGWASTSHPQGLPWGLGVLVAPPVLWPQASPCHTQQGQGAHMAITRTASYK